MDILAAFMTGYHAVWFENLDGRARQWKMNVIHVSHGANSAQAVDFDRDGDIDVLSTRCADHIVVWYENMDTRGFAWKSHIISSNVGGVVDAAAADIDMDGDMDAAAVGERGWNGCLVSESR